MKIDNLRILYKRFIHDCASFSFIVACGRLIRDIPFIAWNRRRSIYEKSIYRYLNHKYGYLIQHYESEEGELVDNPVIWVMWWQGINGMPPLVKACYENLISISTYEVILITKDNYYKWINMPSFINKKVNDGRISITHFSDIVRIAILEQYGGLWVDATMYLKSVPEEVFRSYLYTLHNPGMFPDFISRGEWSTFLMSTNIRKCRFYSIILVILLKYWQSHNEIIDYLLFDYIIRIIIDYHSDIKECINNLPINRHYYDLNLSINEEYNTDSAREMINGSTFQKLTYKKKFNLVGENGKETYYSKIISREF